MTTVQPDLTIQLNPANPGQFFACCGLLELADRLWNGATGWFDPSLRGFHLAAVNQQEPRQELLPALARCPLNNIMTPAQRLRLDELQDMKTKDLDNEMQEEKKSLEKLWRELPLVLGEPFRLSLDWFLDARAGGSRFKTWAGQQSVIDIARAMKQPLESGNYVEVQPTDWLSHCSGSAVTFNFDADASIQTSALDVGFSLDPLKMNSRSRPLLELLAFIGLQRFRPAADPRQNAYTYSLWLRPMLPVSVMAAIGGATGENQLPRFTFPLLYRTKYLKSFLPAQPLT